MSSKCLTKALRTLQVDNQYTMQNSTEFAEFVLNQHVADDEELVSFDVMPLFTSIPVRLVTDFVKTKCQQSDGWKGTTTLTELQAIALLEFVLGNRYFTHQGMYYHQLFSCPVGSPISAVVTDPVMANRGTGLVYFSS